MLNKFWLKQKIYLVRYVVNAIQGGLPLFTHVRIQSHFGISGAQKQSTCNGLTYLATKITDCFHACTSILLIKPSIWVPDDSYYNNLFLTQHFIPGVS